MEEDSKIIEEIMEEDRICKRIDKGLCGELVERIPNYAVVRFNPTQKMITDDNNLVHYGFLFSSAAYCALSAVNKSNSIVIYSEVKFLSPVELGNEVVFKANVLQNELKKREVEVIGELFNIKVFEAMFHIVVFEQSIFKIDFSNIN